MSEVKIEESERLHKLECLLFLSPSPFLWIVWIMGTISFPCCSGFSFGWISVNLSSLAAYEMAESICLYGYPRARQLFFRINAAW